MRLKISRLYSSSIEDVTQYPPQVFKEDFSEPEEKGKKMSVLQIWNTAGVASTLAAWMDKIFGTRSFVITRRKFDPHGHTVYGSTYDEGTWIFALRCLSQAFWRDVVHIHDFDKLVPILKKIYPHKQVLLHYHGTRIRGNWKERRKYWSAADAILISTPDLFEGAPEDTIYLPNPVNTKRFNENISLVKHPKKGFHVEYGALEVAREYARQNGLSLCLFERNKTPLPQEIFAQELSKYEYYIDVKRGLKGNILEALSLTGLEALACGCKVIDWKGDTRVGLPYEHRPEYAAKYLFKIYEEILG